MLITGPTGQQEEGADRWLPLDDRIGMCFE